MKKMVLWLLCFILVITITVKETKASYEETELSQMTEIAKQNNITVDSWTMYIKEPIKKYKTMDEMDARIDDIQKGQKDYQWSNKQFVKGHYQIEGTKVSTNLSIEEKILIIIYSQNGKYNLSVTYDVKGKWDENKWPNIFEQYKAKIENYSTFYTIQGTTTIKHPLYTEASKVLSSFSGVELQSLKEDQFVSLSAYTEKWKTKLSIGDNEYMNLHIAYRATSESMDHAKVTIGTPIITSEY